MPPHHDHHDHGHGHGHDHGHDGHDHSDDVEPALQKQIYSQIEFDRISTLNESRVDAGVQVVKKTWNERLSLDPKLESDADEQILMMIPFAGTVKLHSILLRTSDSESAPKTLKVFVNREDLDFEAAQDLEPTQTLELSRTNEIQDIAVKRSLFNNSYNLTLFFEDNFGADATEVLYIGLKGDFMRLNRDPVEVLYEAAANPQDHAPIVGINNMASHSNQQGR